MGSASSNPIEELKALDAQVLNANDLGALRPIFYRLNEIASQHSNNFQVQLAVGDIKQHLVSRGEMIKQRMAPVPDSLSYPVFPLVQPPLPPMTAMELDGTVVLPIQSVCETQPPLVPAAADSPSVKPKPPLKSNRVLWLSLAAVIVIAIAYAAIGNAGLKRFASWFGFAAAEAIVEIGTAPPGASIRIDGEAKCKSGCNLALAPGKYTIEALLDGYEPALGSVTLTAGKHSSLVLTLVPQLHSVRIFTDLTRGKIAFDSQLPADMQSGRYLLERVPPGHHTVKVMGPNYEASFAFELSPAKLPSVTGTVMTQNVLVVLVASLASQARVVTSSGPWKLMADGQPENDAGPSGVDLKSFRPGRHELAIAHGNGRHNVKENFDSAPTLTAFLKNDRNEGILIVSTGENDVRVLVNSKEYLSGSGPLRVRTIGPVVVSVSKDGFEDPPLQISAVRKGVETRLEFKMKPRQ